MIDQLSTKDVNAWSQTKVHTRLLKLIKLTIVELEDQMRKMRRQDQDQQHTLDMLGHTSSTVTINLKESVIP